MKSNAPLVSVVIPAFRRHELVLRAADSALACAIGMDPGSIEVIVVANGEPAPASVSRHPGLRVIELADANGNAARNAGLAAANGRFVRFLDDDDYLLPEGASLQHAMAMETGADVCSGAVCLVDAGGHQFQVIAPDPSGEDFVAAMLSPKSTTQPTAHLFRTGFLKGLHWDPARPWLQDFAWMHSIMRRGEARWIAIDQPVGVWQHHGGPRVSTGALKRFPDMALREMAAITSTTIEALHRQERMIGDRRRMAAQALWHYAHLGFAMSPLYWAGIARAALRLDPQSRPEPDFYRRAPWRYVHPVLLECLIAPKRRLNACLRRRRGD